MKKAIGTYNLPPKDRNWMTIAEVEEQTAFIVSAFMDEILRVLTAEQSQQVFRNISIKLNAYLESKK